MPSSLGVVGATAVGKTSFVLALGAKAVGVTQPKERQNHVVSTFLWRGNGHKKTTVYILHDQEEASLRDDDKVFVLVFDLTRRDSLTAVITQWAHLSDTSGRKLLLVGTHADCTSKREVSPAEIREIVGDFHAYEEVCCRAGHSGDEGLLRVQLILMQWTTGVPQVVANNIPLARASICGGFPRPVVTMVVPASSSHSLPVSLASEQHFRMRGDVWLCDPTEEVSSCPVAMGGGGDVKLHTISKAIYDIRGAVAEKSKALAKYRDRQVSHWLTRSRYFGPTESSRHKRWQEEQKKRQQLAQSQHQQAGRMQRQFVVNDTPQEQRGRSASHPDTVGPPSGKPSAQRGPSLYSSFSSRENEDSLGKSLKQKPFTQPIDRMNQRQRQLEAVASPEQKMRVAAIRALRKQRRAASNDIYERSTSPAVCSSYLDCYDEMDMPPQLQPTSPSLDRRTSPLISSPASSVTSSVSWKSIASREPTAFDKDSIASSSVQHSFKVASSKIEPTAYLSTSCLPSFMSSPTPSSRSLPAPRQQSANDVSPCSLKHTSVPSNTVLKLTTLDKPHTESKSLLPSFATALTDDSCFPQPICLPVVAPQNRNSTTSRTTTMCSSSSSENFDCSSDIDDMLETFEGMTVAFSSP